MILSRSRSTKDHHLNKLGRPHIPNATYQSPGHQNTGYWEGRFLKGFHHLWAWQWKTFKGISPPMDMAVFLVMWSGQVIKLFSCSTQLSTKFQLLIKTKIPTMKKLIALSLSDAVFIMLINVKMPTIVGILTFMSRINFVLRWVEHWKSLTTLCPGQFVYFRSSFCMKVQLAQWFCRRLKVLMDRHQSLVYY